MEQAVQKQGGARRTVSVLRAFELAQEGSARPTQPDRTVCECGVGVGWLLNFPDFLRSVGKAQTP